MKRAWYDKHKIGCFFICEFHERVQGLNGIMLFDPKDIQ